MNLSRESDLFYKNIHYQRSKCAHCDAFLGRHVHLIVVVWEEFGITKGTFAHGKASQKQVIFLAMEATKPVHMNIQRHYITEGLVRAVEPVRSVGLVRSVG